MQRLRSQERVEEALGDPAQIRIAKRAKLRRIKVRYRDKDEACSAPAQNVVSVAGAILDVRTLRGRPNEYVYDMPAPLID